MKPFYFNNNTYINLNKVKHKTNIAVIKMIKFFALYLMVILAAYPAMASKKGVNLYDEPRELPQKTLIRQDGSRINLSKDFDESLVLAMFWSRHCMPCVRELDDIKAFDKRVKDNGVRVVLISPSQEWQTPEEQQEFLNKYGADEMDFYTDERGNMAAALGIFTSPNTVLINKSGQEIGRIRGAADWDSDAVVEYIYKLKSDYENLASNSPIHKDTPK